ncbi:4478_t:CDS:2 [Diversispora eburnea]|uniref:4478_t:CDS:1 n=1 Tax=Diversispora eburnea TaxID=1213867 RepID=A0A9N9FND8_9GLOM|nr:4478_t:CDS:2 [Diversispora eburnea]
MSTSFEVVAYVSSQKETFASSSVSGIVINKTPNNKTVDFTYQLFSESRQPECEEFSMGDMVFLSGKFCYYTIFGDTTGIVLTVNKAMKYPNRNSGSWTIINYPKTRLSISFMAVCESTIINRVPQIKSSITDVFEGNEIKYISMKTSLYEEENSITRLVIYATEIDYDSQSNFASTNITNQQIYPNKKKHEILSTTLQSSHVDKNKKNSVDESKNVQTNSQVIAHTLYQKFPSQNKYYASFTQQTPQFFNSPPHESMSNNQFTPSLPENTSDSHSLLQPSEPKAKSVRKRKTPFANSKIEKTRPIRKSPRKKTIEDLATMELESNVDNNINDHLLVRQMSGIEKINKEKLSEE